MYREIQLVRPSGKQSLGAVVIQQAKLGWKLYGNPFDLSGLAVQPMVRDDDPPPDEVGEYRIIEKSGMVTVPTQIKKLHEDGWLFHGFPFSMNGFGAIAMVYGNVPQYVSELEGASIAFNELRDELDQITAMIEAGTGNSTPMTPSEIKQAYESNNNTNAFTDKDVNDLATLLNRVGFSGNFADLTNVPSYLLTSLRAAANGVASLDASGKVPLNQLNVSGLAFKGSWNAATNTPALVDGTGTTGDFYKVGVAGTFNFGNGNYTFAVGDWAMFAAGVWQRLGVSESVSTVNGKLGDVVLTAADVGALPDTYIPPTPPVTKVNGKTGDLTLNAADVKALPDTYTPPAAPIPQLTYVNRFFVRVASTWYRNTSAYDRVVNIATNYVAASPSSMINMRAAGTTTPVFAARSQATGNGACNQVMQAIVPAGWEYQFAPGTSREVSTWFEGDYS